MDHDFIPDKEGRISSVAIIEIVDSSQLPKLDIERISLSTPYIAITYALIYGAGGSPSGAILSREVADFNRLESIADLFADIREMSTKVQIQRGSRNPNKKCKNGAFLKTNGRPVYFHPYENRKTLIGMGGGRRLG